MNKQEGITPMNQPGTATVSKQPAYLLVVLLLVLAGIGYTGCGVYKFRDISIPPDIKTVKVNLIENKATYINTQLTPRLTDKLRQKIVSQTRLSQTNNDNADWVIDGTVTNYSFSTSGISQQQVATNRLTVSVEMVRTNQKDNKVDKFQISRSFEFDAKLSLQQAEGNLSDEMVRSLTDDMFNKLFSDW